MEDDDLTKNGPLTLDQARELLRAVVAEHGEDFRYTDPRGPSCLYVTREYAIEHWGWDPDRVVGQPGKRCVVGTLLDRHGEVWHRQEKFWDQTVEGIQNANPGDYFTPEASEYLRIAQSRQDRGETWGQALEAAEAWAEEWAKARALLGMS